MRARSRYVWARMALELPYQIHDVLEEFRDGQIEIGFVHKGLDDCMNRMDVVFNRLVVAMVVAGGLIGSSLIGIFAKTGPHVLGINVISVIGFALSGLLGLWLLWGVVRSGRFRSTAVPRSFRAFLRRLALESDVEIFVDVAAQRTSGRARSPH